MKKTETTIEIENESSTSLSVVELMMLGIFIDEHLDNGEYIITIEKEVEVE